MPTKLLDRCAPPTMVWLVGLCLLGFVAVVVAAETMPVLEVERQWVALDDPAKDGWPSEDFYRRSQVQIDRLVAQVVNPASTEEVAALSLVTNDFTCGEMRPGATEAVFESSGFSVLRAPRSRADNPKGCSSEAGPGCLVACLRAITAPFPEIRGLAVSVKTVGVKIDADAVRTRHLVSVHGSTASGPFEQSAVWKAAWETAGSGEIPRLRLLEVGSFEEVRAKAPDAARFTDRTEEVLGKTQAYQKQIRIGFDRWVQRISDWPHYENLATPGVAIGDVNGDGREDLYLGQQAGLPNLLLVQGEDGAVREVSDGARVDWLNDTRGVLLIDLDNDGDQDLVVATIGAVVVAENDGTGRFQERAALETGDDTMSLSAADYDQDGDLDLYVTVYFQDVLLGQEPRPYFPAASNAFVYHDARSGGPNALFRNDGRWRFSNVTRQCGLDAVNMRYSFAAAWEDFDNDGDQDLYVANDYGPNNLFRNDAGKFTDIANVAKAEDSASGMSAAWADYDRDGHMDLYVSNMFSSAGRRITEQRRFKEESPQVRRQLRRFARGNSLLRNLGNGTFEDVSLDAGVFMGRWAWGSAFVDFDNDGWKDLVVANGYITTEDTGDL